MRILNTDAEEIDDHIFAAIHSPTDLKIADLPTSPRVAATADDLLKRFLDPHLTYAQAVVLGESGSGKSHLVQWLRLHIPDEPHTLKLTIPKAGTSLRGIVQRLIEQLPEIERAPFQERLHQSGTYNATQAAKVDRFLDALAWSLEHGGFGTTEDELALREVLPAIFRDPTFRGSFFRKDAGTVDELVKHIFVDPKERGSEAPTEFHPHDLPLDGALYSRASVAAKEAIDFIKGEPGMDVRATAFINLCLETAIAQTINFTADNLIELMGSLRRHLERQGKRLILLIEDFARLQGIDTALLQALITPPKQGDERLCELRWAMAVTTGYFNRLDATVRSRTTVVVDMDLSSPSSIANLTARYLNAVRLGDRALRVVPKGTPTPVACTTCAVREPCWSAFGTADEIGLFPFTTNAIDNMAERVGASVNGRFNPRTYLKGVMQPILLDHFAELQQGRFPGQALLGRIGGTPTLSPTTRLEISRADEEGTERRIALLELWDGSGKLRNLAKGIHDAFGLQSLRHVGSGEGHGSQETEKDIEDTKRADAQARRPSVPHVNVVRKWATADDVLPQATVNILRGLVFSSLESFVDWDSLGLKKSDVAVAKGGGGIPFRQVSVNFRNQQVQVTPSLVMLELPLKKSHRDKDRTAVALEALLTYEHLGTWDFKEAATMLPTLLEALEEWAGHVTAQLRGLFAASKRWNPVGAAAELLAFAAYQGGRIPLTDAHAEAVIARIWDSKEPAVLEGFHGAFNQLNKQLCANWEKLHRLVRTLSSGTKGGQAGDFVDPVAVQQAVRLLRHRSLKLTQSPPEESKAPELRALRDLYLKVQEQYGQALDAERERWMGWRAEFQNALGPDKKVSELVQALSELIPEFENAGLVAGVTLRNLNEALGVIAPASADRALEHASSLAQASPTEALARIGVIAKERSAVEQLISSAKSFLAQADTSVQNLWKEEQQKVGAGLQESQSQIRQSLCDLSTAVSTMREAGEAPR